MKILSKTEGLDGLIPAGSVLDVTLEEPAGRMTTKKTLLHRAIIEKDVPYDTVLVARLDAGECAELGLRNAIGAFVGKSSVA